MAGLVTTYGAGAMTNSIPEIREADFLFVIGSNTTEAHPVIAMEMKRAVQRGAKLAVGDPRAIWMTEIADWHLQIQGGTDVWLLNAMAHVILEEGLEDKEFIAANTENFDSVRETVLRYPPEEAEKVTGVPAETIREEYALEYGTDALEVHRDAVPPGSRVGCPPAVATRAHSPLRAARTCPPPGRNWSE